MSNSIDTKEIQDRNRKESTYWMGLPLCFCWATGTAAVKGAASRKRRRLRECIVLLKEQALVGDLVSEGGARAV